MNPNLGSEVCAEVVEAPSEVEKKAERVCSEDAARIGTLWKTSSEASMRNPYVISLSHDVYLLGRFLPYPPYKTELMHLSVLSQPPDYSWLK